MNISGTCAGIAARVLARFTPRSARKFGFWYRKQTVIHPRWLGPITWVSQVTLPGGNVIRAPFQDVQGMSLILNGFWEQPLTQRVLSTLQQGDVFVDIGANMGYYTLLAARAVGSAGRVLAFEPSISNLEALCANIELNRCTNVVVYSQALSDSFGIAALSRAPHYNSGVCTLRNEDSFGNTLASTCAFDLLELPAEITARIRLVKIDVEGVELQALRGMERLLRENQDINLLCELSPQWCSTSEILNYLDDLGFQGECFAGGKWSALDPSQPPMNQCDGWFARPSACCSTAAPADRILEAQTQ